MEFRNIDVDPDAPIEQLGFEAVLVGGFAVAAYVGHRESLDHDYVVADLNSRFDIILDAVESQDDWRSLGGIETGIHQLIRKRPLEIREETLRSGTKVIVPTPEETIRVKAYLTVRRNVVRDYLDVAALSEWFGVRATADVLNGIDEYYEDPSSSVGNPVSSQLARQLGDPHPKDPNKLGSTWDAIKSQTALVSAAMLDMKGA